MKDGTVVVGSVDGNVYFLNPPKRTGNMVNRLVENSCKFVQRIFSNERNGLNRNVDWKKRREYRRGGKAKKTKEANGKSNSISAD